MTLNDCIQALSALTSIAVILVGSLWLKHYLKANFVSSCF